MPDEPGKDREFRSTPATEEPGAHPRARRSEARSNWCAELRMHRRRQAVHRGVAALASVSSAGGLLAAAAMAWAPAPLHAQYNQPPERGGRTYTLGMPPVWKGYAGGGTGWYDPSGQSLLLVRGNVGVTRDLMNPVIGAVAVGAELCGGYRGTKTVDGGVRALFGIPAFRLATGVDWNFADGKVSGIIRIELATRRAGIFGGGSLLRLEWFPGHHHTFGAGISVPLWGRNIGRTRPQRAAVAVERPKIERVGLAVPDSGLDSALGLLREEAPWIARLTMPLLDHGGAEAAKAYATEVAAVRGQLDRAPLATRQRAFHDGLDRVFSEAGAAEAGPRVAAAARRILLEQVLLPYDRLLGQRKDPDGLGEFVASASAAFAGWLLRDGHVADAQIPGVTYAFQGLMDIAEAVRRDQRERWDDSRLVWLPLQLALREEQYDTQAELNALIGQATETPFTRGNRLSYIMNEAFQLEFARSVLAARDYHVLWVHDFRGKNALGRPDRVGFEQVRVYLEALTRRVREYDSTGQLPQYFIFLDQHYFEANDARLWFRLLHAPMEAAPPDLPKGFESWAQEFTTAQAALREAVAGSHVLQAERRQYGDRWLRNRIRVQVSITNPADNSFVSNHVAGIVPMPDNLMRDHRKIAFYDLTEADPWRGRAMYTGMGIGEHYAGRNWEDRAIIIRGPAALAVKAAARHLLEQQGFRPEEMPFPLRPRPEESDTGARVDSIVAHLEAVLPGEEGIALQLHNRTGFAPKRVDVEKAILYTMMPPGSLLYAGDSLWQSYLYASMLVGSAFRGCSVVIIAPSLRSAPSSGAPSMARAHGVLSALLVWRRELDAPIAAQGGVLRVGLYAPRVGVGDLAGRLRQAWSTRPPWMRTLLPSNPAVTPVVDSIAGALEAAGTHGAYLVEADSLAAPKLHLKVNLFLRSAALGTLVDRPEWVAVVREYLAYLARQAGPLKGRPPAEEGPTRLVSALRAAIVAALPSLPSTERARSIAYLTVGSTNMDYRSMVMDGEVQVTVTGWTVLAGVLDLVQLMGLSEWPETQEELDRLLPPVGGLKRKMANLGRLAM
jgi:hypothetical protein